ncbi:uncharacterized protein MELLADRAFT_105440 [Melampsora larici-populina 98AG31]|uniref:phosphatidate cytidylyltransferase n=1 Tax=Melampsora larici-populina (strain 98AG31 / pathotype 3-4-7) TaxID=747676 RepID=F4RI49_MELLP|nr:uncharacterized protein MELLADRAFT_105440 [Melampsora larici-populina 98AG31]EGG07937.1 hypothetical protein MELLADRAFT_105440 [Melampsora larici-populina 98AG31]
MVNSLSSSPSSTDLDDEEDDYEESAPSRAGEGSEDLKAHQSERDSTLVIDPAEKWNEVYNPNSEETAKTPTMAMPSTMQPEQDLTHQRQKRVANDAQYGADHNPTKKWQAVLTRVIWSLVMVVVFVGLMAMGHVYLIVLVFICRFSVFREVTNLFQVGYKASAKEHATSYHVG